ncbi:M14 family metallopeptidase [Nakamurella lactea]|uniref:hypothetical protein n=1 Tax=Nakamurella lactea TaxID=459515 RepID=UPI00048F339A|nr:hypothetical protein [Nakamurella lactea]
MDQWISGQMATVPEYDRFAGADELERQLTEVAAEFPDVAVRRRIATSRLGDPIHALQVGEGDRQALVFALPHPNEPVGGLTAVHLARQLCADPELRRRIGLRFTIVGCIDPDGLRLNEGWLAGPFTRTHYARHFFRPAGDRQVEWTFPVDYHDYYFDAVLPETAGLVRLIDELRPEFMVSLHNSELGGAYYYLSRPMPELYPVLQEIPESVGLPLDRGEPESPEIPRLADGIFQGLGFKPIYDALQQSGSDLSVLRGGDGSGGYAARYGTLTLFSEVPYWHHPASSDASPAGQGYLELLRQQAANTGEFAEQLQRILGAAEPVLSAQDSPFLAASRYFVPGMVSLHESILRRIDDPVNDRPATIAEEFSLMDQVRSFRLRFGGMLLQTLDGELAVGNQAKAIREGRLELAALFQTWCAEADEIEKQVRTLPIRSLVATQYGAILATADGLAGPRTDR